MVWFGAPCLSRSVGLATSNSDFTDFCIFIAYSCKRHTFVRSCSKEEVGL